MEETNTGVGPVPILIGLLVIVAVAIVSKIGPSVMEATIFTDHAMTSHAAQIPYIEECFENGDVHGPYNTSNGRMCEYAEDGGENVYWRIFECEDGDRIIITQFKQGVNRLANYMFNHGMTPVEGDPGC